ncbi:MAG TPA: hypothetical protein VHC22_12780 [Pirellulales bacterium]|nr:hypothetical protein [Pirellulales bacterium]
MPRKAMQTQEKRQQPPAVPRPPGQTMGRHAPKSAPQSFETDSVVGAEYLTRNDPAEAMIRFQQKPSQAVLGFLKENGFRWSRIDQAWIRPVRSKTSAQNGDADRRDYGKVVDILRIEQGRAPAQNQHVALQV